MSELTKSPVIVQIVLICFGFAFVLFIIRSMVRHNGKFSWKDVSLSFGQKAATDYRIQLIADYMAEKLFAIRQLFFSDFLRLMKEQGCPEEILVENEDSEFYDQMLGNIIFSGNGIKSIKSIHEKLFLDTSFLGIDYPILVASLTESSRLNAQKYINDHYHSCVRYPDKTQRERIVSNSELVDSLAGTMAKVTPVIESIVSYAKSLYKEERK